MTLYLYYIVWVELKYEFMVKVVLMIGKNNIM